MSLIFVPMSIGFMSHFGFKKMPCRPVELKGKLAHNFDDMIYVRK